MTTLNYSGNVTLYTLNKNGSVSTQNFIISVSNALISNTNRVYKTTVKSSVINQVLLTSAIESLDDSGFDSSSDDLQGYAGTLLYNFKNDDNNNNDNKKKSNDNDFNYNKLTVQITGTFRGNNITIKGVIDKLLTQ